MKNSDMPSLPLGQAQLSMGSVNKDAMGLTKREYFAALAMQGMAYRNSEPYPDSVAYDAVQVADALLAELEKTK